MTYGYSDDLREKALKFYDKSGKSQAEVCEIFGIGVRTFAQWVRLRKAGDFRRRPQQSPRSTKIDGQALAAYIDAYPDAYLREIAVVFEVSDVGILKACRRLGITRKKNSAVLRAQRGRTGAIPKRSRADSTGKHRVGR